MENRANERKEKSKTPEEKWNEWILDPAFW
jgi:hypothetical protein